MTTTANIPRRPGAGPLDQRLRLASGLVLFTFALTHFLNHALGNVSLAAMQAGQDLRYVVWSSLPGQVVLYGAFTVHVGLGLAKLARRRTLRMPAWEASQILLGLAIPYVLIKHVIATRGAMLAFDTNVDYRHELSVLWPGDVWWQSALLLLVWTHGCIGLHFWLRLKPWYREVFPALAVAGVVVPLLALTGWIHAARLTEATIGEKVNFAAGQRPQLLAWVEMARWAALALLAAVLAMPLARRLFDATRPKLTLRFADGRTVQTRPGPTLLEMSRENRIPLTSICGGRARCSTCRTLVLAGGETLPPPKPAERSALEKVGAERGVRLACQIRPMRDLEVKPLLGAGRSIAAPQQEDPYRWGVEQPVVVMFVDLRGFTGMTERRLPYDTVFILNRYLDGAASVIRAAGGSIDKVMGDGIMALFGIERGAEAGARQALQAVVDLDRELDRINADLKAQIDTPLRLGIGLHAGPAILGRIGLASRGGPQAAITALGDTVNVASRLEGATKELAAFAVISRDTFRMAGHDPQPHLGDLAPHALAVRGRAEPLAVLAVADGGSLAALLADPAPPTGAS